MYDTRVNTIRRSRRYEFIVGESFSETDAPKDDGNRPGASHDTRTLPARRRLQKAINLGAKFK